jgi:hypothetical protein
MIGSWSGKPGLSCVESFFFFGMTDAFVALDITRARASRLLKTLPRKRKTGQVACWRCAFDGVV